MKILKENKILSSLKESENVKGLTIKEVAEKLFDGYIDIDVTDKDIDMMVAFVYNFNEPAKDSYDDFLNILGEKTKVLEMNNDVLLCDFTSVFKPYNDLLMNDFNMDESEFDDSEAYYEAVVNLEGLLPGFAPEYFYEDLYKILKGEGEKLEPINQFNHTSLEESDEIKIINPDDKDYSDGKLYKVGLYPGAGVELNTYYVYALYEEDALNQVVAYLDKQNSGLLITYDEMSNIVDNDYADEFKSFEQETGSDDWFEFVESDLSYTYVDATIEGAREPYFIDSENMVIEEVKDINESLTEGYMGVKGAEYINRGNWSDGAVRYRGFIYNAYEIQEALADYFEQDLKDNGKEVPSDNDYFTEFDKWIKENPDKAAGEVESLLYDYTPESIDNNIVSEIENEYSYKRLIKTMESWKTRTDIPEETINEWIQMAKEHCEGNDFDEEENVSEIVNDIVYEMEDHDNLVKWFTITESVNIKESSIPRNAKRIKVGNDEYYRDGSNWGKTSEKDLAIPRRYPSSFLRGQGDVEVLEVDKKYKPKRTREYRVLQGDYGSGWDDLVSYDTKDEQQMKDLRQNWKDYRDNEPNVPHRIITRREPIDELNESSLGEDDISLISTAMDSIDDKYAYALEQTLPILDKLGYKGIDTRAGRHFIFVELQRGNIMLRDTGIDIEALPNNFSPVEMDLLKQADEVYKANLNNNRKYDFNNFKWVDESIKEAVTTSEPENATKPNKPNRVRNYLNYELEDDDTETGGVSFNGETVADFIGDADISEDDDLDKLNKALVSCGIRPIAEGYLTDYRGDDYWDLSDAYVNGSIDDRELAWELVKMYDSYDAAERAFKEITDGKKMPSFGEDFEDIKEITPDEANQLIGEWNNERMSVAKGRYLAQDGESKFIAIDNRTGDCWVEEFSNKGSAIDWLEDRKEVNESLKEEVRTDQEEGFEIDDELAKQCDRLSYKGINTRYDWDTNTLIFSYANEFLKEDDDLDTIIYRNETPEQIKDYIDKQLLPYLPMGERALKELVNKGVLQSVKSKKNGDNTVEYLIAYEIPMIVGSTDRVITADDSSLEALVKATKKSANELGDDIYGSLTDENDFYGYDTKEEMEERIDDEKAILDNIATDLENMLGSSNINEAVSSKNPAVDSLVKLFNKKRKSSIDIYNIVGDYDLDLEYDFTLEDIEKEESQIELGRPNSKDDINRDLNAMIIRVLDYVDKPTADMLRKQSKIKTSIDLNEAVDEEGNFTSNYLINGGEYALSILERTPTGGEVDLLVKAKDGKGNSAIMPGYDQIEGFEFTEEDEPFYSDTSAGSEDIAKLFKKFKPDVEVTSIKRLLDDGTVDEESYAVDEYTFKPGYHEWILAKNGETISTYSSSTIDEIPGTSHKEIEDYVTGMVDMDDELDGYNKQDIIEVMTRVLYSYYGDLNESSKVLTESRPDKEAAKAKMFRDSRRRLSLPKEGIKSKEQVLQYLKKCKDDVDVMNVNDSISSDVLRNAMLDLGFNFHKETGVYPSNNPEEFIKYMEDGVQKLNESDTGYDYWGPKSMERFDGPAFIQYYGGPGDMEYLQKARNGRYVWVNSANVGDPYVFDSYEDALEVQKQFGGEIIDYNREYLGKDDTDEE